MKSLNYVRYAFITAAACMFATSSDAAWTYIQTEEVSGVGKGSITDGVWTFYAERVKGVTDELTVDASKGMSIDPAQPAKIDFSEVADGYKVVKFVGVRNQQSPLVLYTTEFIAPCCTNLSGQEIFYPGKNTYNTTLTKIQLREDVAVTLGNDRMFCNCTSLSSFSPKKIANKTLYTEMFLGCSSLEGEFEFPECTQFVGNAFYGCSKIGGINAEKAVIIAQSVFGNCSNLSNIVLSAAVEQISNYAFNGCSKITTEFVQGLLHKGLKQLGNTATDRKGCFANCTGLTGSIVWNLPNLITNAVPDSCFSGCTSLERVEIKSPVSVIGGQAFNNLKPGAEIFLHNTPAESYGNFAIATIEAPFPKVYINKDCSDAWLDCMCVAGQNHLMKKNEFSDTSWVSNHGKKYAEIERIMNKDSTMCNEMVVDNRNVLAFLMSDNKAGCWILKKPEEGFKVIVR